MVDIKKTVTRLEIDKLRDVVKMLADKHKEILVPLLHKLEDQLIEKLDEVLDDKIDDLLDVPEPDVPADPAKAKTRKSGKK